MNLTHCTTILSTAHQFAALGGVLHYLAGCERPKVYPGDTRYPLQAESDASSEMSEDALQKLVSRLVEAGGDLEKDDHAETPSVGVSELL